MAYQAHDRVSHQRPGGLRPGLPIALSGLLALGGCIGGGGNEGPGTFWDNATGRAMERRGLPPRLDQPYPNLSQVPPRPARPDVATRDAVTRGLEAERLGAETPVIAGLAIPAPPAGASSGVPLAPPGPVSLRSAPRIVETPLLQWPTPTSLPVPAPAAPARTPAPAEPVRTLPADPGVAPPPPPPPALLAPPARMLPADPGSIPPPPPSVR